MGAGFQVNLTNWREAVTLIKNLNPLVAKYQLEELLTKMENLAISISKNTFRTQSDPSGIPWAPISETTYRLGKPRGSPTLVRSGALRRSVHGQIIQRARGPELIIQSDLPYAEKHQLGDKLNRLMGQRAPIPARQFVGLSDTHVARFEQRTAEWLDRYVDRPARLTRATRIPKRLL